MIVSEERESSLTCCALWNTDWSNVKTSHHCMICKLRFLGWIKQTSFFWCLRIAIKVKTTAVTYRSRKHAWVWYTLFERSWRTDHMVYSCTDTYQYIHVVSTHILDNVLICLVYVAVFSQCAQMYQLYELLISFGSLVSFWSLPSVLFLNDIKIYLEISLQKKACRNKLTVLWESPFNLLVYFAEYSK